MNADNDDELRRKIDEELESIADMAHSAEAIKGKQFVHAALSTFESLQVLEIAAMLADDRMDKELLESMANSMASMLHNICSRVSKGMSDEDLDEAYRLGTSMMARKMALQDSFNEGDK